MEKRDWTLLATHFASQRGISPAQLQKSLFLFGMVFEDSLKDYYDFKPYHYGPFTSDIYFDAEHLDEAGLLSTMPVNGRRWEKYFVTEEGARTAVSLLNNIDKEKVDYLETVVQWATSIPFTSLIKSIYKQYPKYAKNSLFVR